MSKNQQKTASLNCTFFKKRYKKKLEKLNFWKIFWFLNEFLELKINEKHRKTNKPKSGKFACFLRKLVHIFQGKRKDGFTNLK